MNDDVYKRADYLKNSVQKIADVLSMKDPSEYTPSETRVAQFIEGFFSSRPDEPYTPDTETVRTRYGTSDRAPEFDRWLNRVKEQEWDAAFKAARKKEEYGIFSLPDNWNPYRTGR